MSQSRDSKIIAMNSTKILDESLQWLRQHPHPECADLPTHLIDHWKLELPAQHDELPAPSWGVPLAIYGFGYLQSRLLAEPSAPKIRFETNTLLMLAMTWQLDLLSATGRRWPFCTVKPGRAFRFEEEPPPPPTDVRPGNVTPNSPNQK